MYLKCLFFNPVVNWRKKQILQRGIRLTLTKSDRNKEDNLLLLSALRILQKTETTKCW